MLALLGRIVGKAVAEAVIEEHNIEKNDLEGLKIALENILPKVMQFEAAWEEEKLKTRSNCPIYKNYKEWCDKGCVPMIESFARIFNPKIKVKRTSREPDKCEFEFSVDTETLEIIKQQKVKKELKERGN